MTVTIDALTTTAAVTVSRACALLGMARSTYYRLSRGYRHYQPVTDPIRQADRVQPAALSQAEREQIITVLDQPEYADLSVVQTYWRAFDTGLLACSQRTFYRVAATLQLTGDRRRTRHGGSSRKAPAVAASRPDQLWSWDATELKGPGQQRYKLMLVLDVYSRYPIGWKIETTESYPHAIALFTTAIGQHHVPEVVHADNGSVMRSHELIDTLHDHGILTSHSRPRISNDNPFSESMFKTIKYDLNCPDRFDDIDHARTWTAAFLHRYATEHRHSGLGYYTPTAVYHHTATTDQDRRQAHLDQYWRHHPERFHHHPQATTITPTGINTHLLSQTG
ncbi:IS3 family transposase [Microlunatus phosphovorus]|nr:IS3 family transposase [Microlunatus phosphovorus]